MHVLITGMSGAGKSPLVRELRERGYTAYDADDDGFAEPRADGRWGWRTAQVAELLTRRSSERAVVPRHPPPRPRDTAAMSADSETLALALRDSA